MIEAVALDLDDTVCLTEAVCFDLENEVLTRIGQKPMSRQVHLDTWGQPLFEIISTRSPGVDIELFRSTYHPLIAEYTASGKLDTIPEENYQAMDELVRLGKTILVLTSRTHAELAHLLAPDHLLATRVKTFYYRDNTRFHKPDQRAFDELLSQNQLVAEQCVYVGDSLGDARSAKDRGLHFIASLESGLRQKEDFDGLGVDRFINRFPEVVKAVQSLDGADSL